MAGDVIPAVSNLQCKNRNSIEYGINFTSIKMYTAYLDNRMPIKKNLNNSM